MSMPSSRLLVATRQGRRPALSSSSISVRCSRARLPWWARATSSSASSLRRSARRSARRRLLTKISVERWARTSASSSGYIAGQIERRRPSLPGTSRPAPRAAARRRPARACPRPGRSPRSRAPWPRRRPRSSTGRGRPSRVLPAEEAGDLRQRALGGREADALQRAAVLGHDPLAAAPGSATGGRRAWCRPRRGSRR